MVELLISKMFFNAIYPAISALKHKAWRPRYLTETTAITRTLVVQPWGLVSHGQAWPWRHVQQVQVLNMAHKHLAKTEGLPYSNHTGLPIMNHK